MISTVLASALGWVIGGFVHRALRRPKVCRYMRRVGPILVTLEAPTIPELLALVDGLDERRLVVSGTPE